MADEIYTEGVKFDEDKPRISLVHPAFILELAKLATTGAKKYGDHNWELGMDWNRPYDALHRHAIAWATGEPDDAETGTSHLIAIAWNAMVLWTYERFGLGRDTLHINKTRGQRDPL